MSDTGSGFVLTLGGTQYTFSAAGGLLGQTAANGQADTLNYSAGGELESHATPVGDGIEQLA